MAYLVSRYPAVSHTFILNEVIRLRDLGIAIDVASINNPDRPTSAMTQTEQSEHERTYYVKKHGIKGALMAVLWHLTKPRQVLGALAKALRLGGADPKQTVLMLAYLIEAMMLAKWMAAHKLTHLHVHFASQAATVGLLLKHLSAHSYSFTVHGPDEFYNVDDQRLRQKLAAADFVVCIGAFARSQLMLLSHVTDWPKFSICRLGIDPGKFNPANRPHRKHAKDGFQVLCIGRLVGAKGQHVLIQACKQLVDQQRAVRLVIVGTGPDESSLKTQVTALGLDNSVKFTGALNHDQITDQYARADAFALASFAEGIPVVLMEAMASGVPVVSTRITGIPELIQDGHDGRLVSPSDASELAGAIAELMDDPQRSAEFARHAREKVVSMFNLERNVSALADIFRREVGYTATKKPLESH
jgi:glycosyltransferase involved in cell wall biosynthesis